MTAYNAQNFIWFHHFTAGTDGKKWEPWALRKVVVQLNPGPCMEGGKNEKGFLRYHIDDRDDWNAGSGSGPKSPMWPKKMAVANQLAQQFGEVPIVSGISLNNSMKFFGNPRSGSWSMIFVGPDGIACVLAVGEDLEVSSLAFTQNTGASPSAPDQFRLVK